ncbi:hypothetical protein, partial [Stenotrophomonas sepilia]
TVLPSRPLRLWTHFCERGASPLVAANLGWQQLFTLLFSFDFEFPLSFRARRKLSPVPLKPPSMQAPRTTL